MCLIIRSDVVPFLSSEVCHLRRTLERLRRLAGLTQRRKSPTFATVTRAGSDVSSLSGFAYKANMSTSWNLLYCDLTIRNVRYTYTSSSASGNGAGTGSFKTVSLEDASVGVTQLFAAVSNVLYIPQNIPAIIEGVGVESGNYADAFGLELSREWLAFGSWFWEPAAVLSIEGSKPVLGSSIKLLPLSLYIGTTSLFWYALLPSLSPGNH